jgi:hypothetical protein
MTETTPQAAGKQQAPAKDKLSKEQRSQIMRAAATKRWDKTRKAQAKAAKAAAKPSAGKKRPAGPREFSSALKVAEKRLAMAITERAKAAALYATACAEIPSLMQIINSLKNPLGVQPYAPQYGYIPAPSLEEIVGDRPLAYQNPPLPPRRDIPAPQPVPQMPVPQALHPANTMGRAGGGAVEGVELAEEDEDQFLNEASGDLRGAAGGLASQWR